MHTKDASVLICYKNFAANLGCSHIGLGVAALNNQKVLRALGVAVDVLPLIDGAGLVAALAAKPRTHVIVSAPWIPTAILQSLTQRYPDTIFYVVSHSQVAFLQADPNGIKIYFQGLQVETATHNFHIAANNSRFIQWVQETYGCPCSYLPNCYYLDGHTPLTAPVFSPGTPLRIGMFGATRPLKNMVTGAAAALTVARQQRSPLELYISGGRVETDGLTIINAIRNLLSTVPWATTNVMNWQSWPAFRETCARMHLLMQVSFTESFSMVSADGVSEGVASVVSNAIDWAPPTWKAMVDDAPAIAKVALHLLHDRNAVHDGLRALMAHNARSTRAWGEALGLCDLPPYQPPRFL